MIYSGERSNPMCKMFTAALVTVLLGSGCNLPRPNWGLPPGTMAAQQYRALEYDPYGDNDAGPEIVGGRPREFQRPLPEPERAQFDPYGKRNGQAASAGQFQTPFPDPVRARGFRDTRWPF